MKQFLRPRQCSFFHQVLLQYLPLLFDHFLRQPLESTFCASFTSTVTSSELDASLSSTTVSLNESFESAADSGTSKDAVSSSDCLRSTLEPSVCSHLYETICPSSSELFLHQVLLQYLPLHFDHLPHQPLEPHSPLLGLQLWTVQ